MCKFFSEHYTRMNSTSHYWSYNDFYTLTFLYYLHFTYIACIVYFIIVYFIIFTIHYSTRFSSLQITFSLLSNWNNRTNAKLLSNANYELPFFKKPIKAKIKQLTNEELYSEQPFYKQPKKKAKRKQLTNQQLLRALPVYDDDGIFKRQRAFRNYFENYEVEAIDKKSLRDSLVLSKHSIKNLFNDLLREKQGFKYILSIKITFKKQINDNETLFITLYFNSEVKTITNQRYYLNDSFEKGKNLFDIWISEGSGSVIDKVEGIYINVTNYEPLSGSSYIPLPKVLNNSKKGLINLKNKDHKCFMWCHIRMLNPQNRNAERTNKEDKKIAANLNYSGIEFPLNIDDYELTEGRFWNECKCFWLWK